MALDLFLLGFFLAIVVAFAIGVIVDAPSSLGLGCAFAAAWYMAIGGIAIVAAAIEPRTAMSVILWFSFYGLVAAAAIFMFCLFGTLVGMVRRVVIRSVAGNTYD